MARKSVEPWAQGVFVGINWETLAKGLGSKRRTLDTIFTRLPLKLNYYCKPLQSPLSQYHLECVDLRAPLRQKANMDA